MKMLSSYHGFHEVQSALAEFSKVLTRAGCVCAIYLGMTRELSCVFYELILLLKCIFYSLLTYFSEKGKS